MWFSVYAVEQYFRYFIGSILCKLMIYFIGNFQLLGSMIKQGHWCIYMSISNPGQTFVGVADFVPHYKDTARDSNAARLSAFTTFYWVIWPRYLLTLVLLPSSWIYCCALVKTPVFGKVRCSQLDDFLHLFDITVLHSKCSRRSSISLLSNFSPICRF